jgi:hypothetical protein
MGATLANGWCRANRTLRSCKQQQNAGTTADRRVKCLISEADCHSRLHVVQGFMAAVPLARCSPSTAMQAVIPTSLAMGSTASTRTLYDVVLQIACVNRVSCTCGHLCSSWLAAKLAHAVSSSLSSSSCASGLETSRLDGRRKCRER